MAYEVLVLDIDGTLTNSQKKISKTTLEAILAVQERGHKVVLASGRPTPGILPIARQIHLEEYGGYILSFNGAKIIRCAKSSSNHALQTEENSHTITQELIYQKTLPKEYIPAIYESSIEYNVGLITYTENEIITSSHIDRYIEKEAQINHIPLKQVPNFVEYVTFDLNKCLMTGDGDYLETIEKKMKERFGHALSIYRSEPFFLELMPQHIDKANSLSYLLEHLHLSKEQMICCGDGYNDLSMIKYAGMGVAMENAQEIVKSSADYITKSNDCDGVAHVINEFML